MVLKKTAIQLIKEAANKLKGSKLKRITTPHTQTILEGVIKGVGLMNLSLIVKK